MIPLHDFEQLRLRDYLPPEDTGEVEGWEFLDRVWHAEISGFTAMLSSPREPGVTRCVVVHASALPVGVARRLLEKLDLGLEPGANLREVRRALGTPVRELRFTPDRVTLEFQRGQWTVSTTVHEGDGLIYLYVHSPLPPT